MERQGSSRIWLVARIALIVSLIPLGVAIWLLADPVVNPGVQECGSPGAFVVTGRLDSPLPIPGDEGYTDATPALVAQPSCSMLVNDRFEAALWVAGAFGFLACLGAILGLIDDRLLLRRAPRFETLLRERPAEAPGVYWDRPVVPADDLGIRLPELERSDLWTIAIVGVVMWGVTGLLVGYRAVADVLTSLEWGQLVLLLLVWLVSVVAVAIRFVLIRNHSGGRGRVLGVNFLISLSTCFEARIRPAFGWSGNWLHHRIRLGEQRERVIYEVSTLASLSVVVHVAMLFMVGIVFLISGVDRQAISAWGWLLFLVLLLVMLRGAFNSAARYDQLLAAPGRAGLRALEVLVRRDPIRLGGLVATSLVQCLCDALALFIALRVVGSNESVSMVLFVALFATALGTLSPFDDGLGVLEPVAILALWRFGVEPAGAVVAVFIWRMTIRWLPMLPGAISEAFLSRAAVVEASVMSTLENVPLKH